MIKYLSGMRSPALDAAAANEGEYGVRAPIGVLVQPLTAGYLRDADRFYRTCGIDNGCFTEVGRRLFCLKQYERMTKRALDAFGGDMLFATAPDVPFDWAGTLAQSLPVLDVIRGWGAPAAMVWQDGATVANMPWDAFDVGFIGGSTEWKLGPDAAALTREAGRRRKLVHMGRVNSSKRFEVARVFGCESADGTYLKCELDKGTPDELAVLRMLDWVRAAFGADAREVRADLAARFQLSPDRIAMLAAAGLVW